MLRILGTLMFLLTAVSVAAQQAHTGSPEKLPPTVQTVIRELPLQVSGEPVHTKEWVSGFIGPIACDADENVYVRLLAGAGSPFENSITRISKKGNSAQFDAGKVPGISGKQFYVFTYAVEDNGRMFQLVGLPDEESDGRKGLVYLVAFSRDGEYLWKSKFKTVFEVSAFIPLPDEEFFVAGMEPARRSEESKPLVRTSFAGIFGRDGELKHALKLGADTPASNEDKKGGEPLPMLRFDDAKLGDDGKVYIMQPSPAPRVFVVGMSGKPVRVLSLQPSSPGTTPLALFVSGNRLLIEYQFQKASSVGGKAEAKITYGLYDAQTGELLVNYRPDFLGTVACLNQSRITVLQGGSDRHFAIANAQLR